MKKGILILFIILVLGGIGYFVVSNILEEKRIEEIKKGWYVEVIHDTEVNVRDKASVKGNIIGKAKPGKVFKVLEVNLDDPSFYWYNIEFDKNNDGWIATYKSKKKVQYLEDVNDPTDIAVPEIVFFDDVYKVVSIDKINYKHLEVREDTDKYTITHVIYHEVDKSMYIDQYWIEYTITDGAGKSSSKLQKIEFEEKPSEEEVKDFGEYRRK